MKIHLAKRFSGNRVSLKQSECGRSYYGISQVIRISKTSKFKEAYKENKNNVCLKCAGIAKEQGRLI
jgi:hypothetical protein